MRYPYYKAEIIGVDGQTIDEIDDIISLEAARAFNVEGAATMVVPNHYQRSLFRMHTRMRLWRYDHLGRPINFGDTVWFLKKKDHAINDKAITLNWVDAFAMIGTRIVAYTSITPYADKTLEEFALITYNNTLRIDSMMIAYMKENFGTLALDTARLNTYLNIPNSKNQGPYGEKQAAWQQIDAVLSDLASQAGAAGMNIYYDLIPADNGELEFRIFTILRGLDRRPFIILNDTDGMIDDIHEIEDWSEVATACYALGYDSGPSQVIEVVESPFIVRSDPFGRIEMTINATDSEEATVLKAAARAALNGKRPKRLVTARVVENNALRYGDIVYGDLLTIEVAGQQYDVAVNAIRTRWDASGEDLEIRLSGEAAFGPVIPEGPADPGIQVPGALNTRPVVDAGDDQEIDFGAEAVLVGSAVDDGLPNPPGVLTYQWSKVSGPGDVTFLDDNDPTTTAEFSLVGTYVLKLSASDSLLNGEDEITIEVSDFVPAPPNPDIIRKSMERVGAMSQYHWYRTTDFQTRAIEGGPTWTRHDVATSVAERIYSYVVNPFSTGYLTGTGEVNAFVAMPDKIVKVTALFGTIGRTTLLTFPTTTNWTTHWRTIQASFGAYFETNNPWLICVSYYADTVGHTGTWCTRSLDGGLTWSAEVQVSAHYDTSLSIQAPIAVFTSPRTPGFCMCVAYKTTASPAVADIFISYDWGATWQAASAIVPAVPMPEIELPDSSTGDGAGGGASATAVGVDGPPVTEENFFYIEAPAGATQMRVQITWTSMSRRTGGGGASGAGNISVSEEGSVTHVVEEETSYGTGSYNEANGGRMLVRFNIGGVGRAKIGAHAGANKVGSSIMATSVKVRGVVTEITPAAGDPYTPPLIPVVGTEHGQGGSMHIPWLDEEEGIIFFGAANRTGNRQLKLKAVTGLLSEDVSPNDGSRDLGTYFGPFGIRTYDSNLSYALIGARGNDTSTGATDDLVGLYLAQDGGVGGDWAQLLAPVDESNVHMGIQAAFGGTDPAIIFAWGGITGSALEAIYYARDGATLDSREGNLATLVEGTYGQISFIGIAGGPVDDEPPPPEGDGSWYGNPAYYYGDMKAYVLWDNTDVLRTADIQAASPTWARIDTGISGNIIDGRYVHINTTTIGMWLLTDTGVFWCADILAVTPSWSNVLPIATVVAADVAPATGTVKMYCMDAADDQPGYLMVLTGPTVQDSDYDHAYSWHTHDYGANWTQIDMNAFTYTSDGSTRCYAEAGRFGLSIFRKSPSTIFALRNTARTGSSDGRTAVFKSTDLGTTWTKEHEFLNWSTEGNRGSILAPFPYLDSPSYISRATTGTSQIALYVSIDGWATAPTTITPPALHDGGFGNLNVIKRMTKRVFTENHVMGILVDTGSSGGDLYESYDKGVTWAAALLDASNNHTNPNPWPLDPYQWVLIRNNGGTSANIIRLTLDNFATLSDKNGNLTSVLSGGTWANGICGGFALPKVPPNT